VPVECRQIHESNVARFSSDAKEASNSSTLTVAGIPFLATCFWLLGRCTDWAASALASTAALRAVAPVPHVALPHVQHRGKVAADVRSGPPGRETSAVRRGRSGGVFGQPAPERSTRHAMFRGYPGGPGSTGRGWPEAAATGYFRIAADQHWLTDVAAGAAAGAGVGLGVTWLHRGSATPTTLRVLPAPGGMTIAGRF